MNWQVKHFNELTPTQLYDLIKLRLEVFIGEQGCSYEDLDDKDKKAHHVFLYNQNDIIACCRILEAGVAYEEMSIGRVCVHENYRNQGIAKEMMQIAMGFIKENNKEGSVKISAQSYIIPFYESLGFKVISDAYLEEGIEHRKMQWKYHLIES